jgi:hypothetical protein
MPPHQDTVSKRNFNPRDTAIKLVSSTSNMPARPVTGMAVASSHFLSAPADGANLTATSTSIVSVGLDGSTTTALTGMPPSSDVVALPTAPVNFLTQPRLPREVRGKIYAYALPPEIVVKDGKMDTLLGLLFVNRQLRAECLEAIGSSTYEKHLKLRYTSITSLVKGLDSLPDLSLARFGNFTIYSTGPYNGHCHRYSFAGAHSCNICPTFKQRGDRCWFEIEYNCQSCAAFHQRELTYACATITSKIQRLTGVQREHTVPVIVTAEYTLARAIAPHAEKKHGVTLPRWVRRYQREVRKIISAIV